ncbi:competence protein [Chitinophaga caeni]|uniref:Competence protein n=1 Tax=Chitinophaga caeni TaxID=2029983 RepID=A0A291QYI4_9BACT|nr:competence protein CoiA family protein [Chitinophaga caeni]ATL48987.1 competence protein [Chitinophaga caeni]
MKYALVNNAKLEATKGSRGICPYCRAELIAKCGEYKIHHWAHTSKGNCDPWWERETDWHRLWKGNYPEKWQEIVFRDSTSGEKHIADVQTDHGLTIEFQHSNINSEERKAREQFYKNLVWIVDGTRLNSDFPRFLLGSKKFKSSGKQGLYFVDLLDKNFPINWKDCAVPVIFDFKVLNELTGNDKFRDNLYCLFPDKVKHYNILAIISRTTFIDSTKNGTWLKWYLNFVGKSNAGLKADELSQEKQTPKKAVRPRTADIIVKGRFKRRSRL